MARPRRKYSTLGADPRGDTLVPAIATADPTSSFAPSVKHEKRRNPWSALQKWKQFALRNTWSIPFALISVSLGLYAANPTPSNPLHSAIFLSYPSEPEHQGGPQMYGKGPRDIVFVAFYTVVLTFTRELIMQRVVQPAAVLCGLKKRGKIARFMEQGYAAMHHGAFGFFGMYVMYRSPVWYFNTTAMFDGFPHTQHEGLFKAYYLLEASFWSQQAIVMLLLLEKPRKDFKELVLHHIITVSLIALSYRFHFTYMGLAVYVTHDISDFFFATSKLLNYLDSIIVGPYFALFIAIWIYLRHYLNLGVLWAVLTEFRTVGPYELNWETQQYKCWISQIITFSLLACLQSLNLFWLYLIFRVARDFVYNNVVADVRSEDEEEDDEGPVAAADEPVTLIDAQPVGGFLSPANANGLKKR